MGPGGFFPNPDLANIWGRTDLDFEIKKMDSKFLDFQVSRFPNSQISRSPDLQIPRFPGSQISRFPDFQAPGPAPPPDEFSDPNLTPLPTHPGITYVASDVCAMRKVRNDRPPPRAPLLLCAEEVEPWLTTQWQTEK